jgi:hypothetical protein
MDSYTITIAPNDDSGAATRLVVDTSGDQVRITDVHLHAPQGLSSGHIPTVDFDLLLRAVTGTATASNGHGAAGVTELSGPQHSTPELGAAVAAEPAERPALPAAPKRRARKVAPAGARARTATKASEEEAAAPRRSASASRTGKQGPVKAGGKRTAAAPTPAKRTAAAPAPAKRTRSAAPATTGRVYRRTPDDLAEVFAQVETVAGVAAHYQVPRHTAQGWVGRLRATA